MEPLNRENQMNADLLLTQDLQEDLQSSRSSLFNGGTSQRMEKEHLAKLAPASQ
jgi:hypothetical protein